METVLTDYERPHTVDWLAQVKHVVCTRHCRGGASALPQLCDSIDYCHRGHRYVIAPKPLKMFPIYLPVTLNISLLV
jgi:hypothetical protein